MVAKENYEKTTAKAMLALVEQYISASDKKPVAEKLNKIADDVYYKKLGNVSQKMIDISLALHSFTKAGLSGGRFQDFEEFVEELREIIEGYKFTLLPLIQNIFYHLGKY